MCDFTGLNMQASTELMLAEGEKQVKRAMEIAGVSPLDIDGPETGAAIGMAFGLGKLAREYALHYAYIVDQQTKMLEELRKEVKELRN